jgi:hypothetical protein
MTGLDPSLKLANRNSNPILDQVARLTELMAQWRPSLRRFALLWAAVALATVAFCIPTLTTAPMLWTDEVHIAEYGRLFFDPRTSWSLLWQGDHPITPWYYIGGVLQELAARASSPSCLGPRLFGLTGALLAAATLAAWLLRRGTLPAASFLLSLLFLFEPVFVWAYRGGRIDGWTLSCGFSACYLIAAYRSSPDRWGRLVAAGSLVALGFFVWPSIAFLLPLIGLELVRAARRQSRPAPPLAAFAIGGTVTFVGLASFAILEMPSVVGDFTKQLSIAGMAPDSPLSQLRASAWLLFVIMLVRSPWTVPLILTSWKSGSSRTALALIAIPLAIMLRTLLYGNRMIYLVPYLIAFYAEAFRTPAPHATESTRPGAWMLLATAVAGAAGLALVLRSIMPWIQRDARSEARVVAAAKEAAPLGATVCLTYEAIEFYFAGRSRGWQMFTASPDVLAHCDTAITNTTVPHPNLEQALESSGFRRESTLLNEKTSAPPDWERHIYGYRIYGPYAIYRRTRTP